MYICPVMQAMHDAALRDLWDKGHDTVYFRDATIEPCILPLVELLNNEWSITTHSCGGHWAKPPRFQYPYVQFRIFRLPVAWVRIENALFKQLHGALDDRLTLEVHGGFLLPEKYPNWRYWRFRPVNSGTFKHSRDVFRNSRDFTSTFKKCIATVCHTLDRAMDAEKKRYGRRLRLGFSGAFKYQLKEAIPLTKEDLRRKDLPKSCHLSGRPFRAGDTILYIYVPTPKHPAPHLQQVVTSKAYLKKQNWRYYPVSQDCPIPRTVLD